MRFFLSFNSKKAFRYFNFLLGGILLMFALIGCKSQESLGASAIIVPHHLLVEHWMQEFYAEVAKEKNDYERIILISPNHLGYGFGSVQTAKRVQGIEIDQSSVGKIEDQSAAFVEGSEFMNEHGLYVHYPFIHEHFPQADIVPIILKQGANVQVLDKLLSSLTQIDLEDTLIIGSIDFSHGVSEELALEHDERIINWLQDWSEAQKPGSDLSSIQALAKSLNAVEGTVAMDSPETFYILIKLLEHQGNYDYELWKRGSSAMVTGLDLVEENVSYLFVKF